MTKLFVQRRVESQEGLDLCEGDPKQGGQLGSPNAGWPSIFVNLFHFHFLLVKQAILSFFDIMATFRTFSQLNTNAIYWMNKEKSKKKNIFYDWYLKKAVN